jgi:hypothetical protein
LILIVELAKCDPQGSGIERGWLIRCGIWRGGRKPGYERGTSMSGAILIAKQIVSHHEQPRQRIVFWNLVNPAPGNLQCAGHKVFGIDV